MRRQCCWPSGEHADNAGRCTRCGSPAPLTLTDAKHDTIVRKALESALVAGVATPELDFGPIYVRMTTSGYWAVIAPRLAETHCRTTDQTVALIVATARGTL